MKHWHATPEGLEAFRDRMCDQLDQLPGNLGCKPLHVSQADLAEDTFFTHRLDEAGHHVVYDPRQVRALAVRQLLGIYAEFTEGPILDGCRDLYYGDGPGTEIWAVLISEIDRTQDPDSVIEAVTELFEHARRTRAVETLAQAAADQFLDDPAREVAACPSS